MNASESTSVPESMSVPESKNATESTSVPEYMSVPESTTNPETMLLEKCGLVESFPCPDLHRMLLLGTLNAPIVKIH